MGGENSKKTISRKNKCLQSPTTYCMFQILGKKETQDHWDCNSLCFDNFVKKDIPNVHIMCKINPRVGCKIFIF